MKTRAVICLLSCFLLVACGPGGLKLTSTPGGDLPPDVEATVTSLPPNEAESCMPGMRLPEAMVKDITSTVDAAETITSLGGKMDWFEPGAELRVYTALMAADDIESFFEQNMAADGWERTGRKPGTNWGYLMWVKNLDRVQFLTGETTNSVIFILACSKIPANPTAIPVETLDYKAAFEYLRAITGYEDLAFYGYESFATNDQALSADYTVVGYSASAQKFCYIQSDAGKGVELTCRDDQPPDDPLVSDLSTLKDGIELVNEAFDKNKPCAEPFNFAINLTQQNAQFLCGSEWSQEIPVYR